MAILVAVAPQAAMAVRINITLQEDILREIDAYAEHHGLTRSGFLARAAKTAIAAEPA